MTFVVLVLGGSGVFGQKVCRHLAQDADIRVIAAGRDIARLDAFSQETGVDTAVVHVPDGLAAAIDAHKPNLVIHAAGPFQGADYGVAEQCIAHGVHYVDLSDGREFVLGFEALDSQARAVDVLAVSGASTVPGLSSAVYEQLKPSFARVESLGLGIAPGNRAPRGLAVMQAILGYTGKLIPRYENGYRVWVPGWQDLRRSAAIHGLGARWYSACDIPDVDLFPVRDANLKTVTFHAGLELSVMHLGLWACSWLVRWGWIDDLARYAKVFQFMADGMAPFGSDRGGMFVELRGVGLNGAPQHLIWSLVAEAGDGPHIPAMAAVILARKLARGQLAARGAMACYGLFNEADFLDAVKGLNIRAHLDNGVPS